MRALAFQLLRELTDERFVSGVALAERFGVSRSAVSEALREAGDAGVAIFSQTRRGYRLAAPLELLDLARVRRELGATARRLDLDIVETVASTNTALIARAAEGAPSGTCLAAEVQTAGRGRRGRAWQSALGGSLTFSLLWRFDKGAGELGGLSLAVGVALARALSVLGAKGVQLKWPNDVVVGHRKLAGVLIESQGEMLGPTAAVIGIGINVALPPAVAGSIDQPVTDVAAVCAAPVSRNRLLARVLKELVAVLDAFAADGFAALRAEWQSLHALHDKPVRILQADGSVRDAVVRGVGADGSLTVVEHGREHALASGELSLRGRA